VIWYAPQHSEAESGRGGATIFDLIPDHVTWIVWQLCVAVALLAVWKGRRIGPLVAEELPVVVRGPRRPLRAAAGSTDRGGPATALPRRCAPQRCRRMLPRLGLGHDSAQPAVVQAVADRCGLNPQTVAHTLYGPPPGDDPNLVSLAHELDNIERQVAQS